MRAWEAEFSPLRKEIESSFDVLRQGKAIYKPMAQEELAAAKGSTLTGLNLRNNIANRRKGSQDPTSKVNSPGGSSTYSRPAVTPPAIDQSSRPKIHSLPSSSSLRPTTSRTSSQGNVSSGYQDHSLPPSELDRRPSNPYFAGANGSQVAASPGLYPVSSRSSAVSVGSSYHSAGNGVGLTPTALTPLASAAAAAAKKKPPPPPPKPKRFPSQQAEYVVALYDFEGQNVGDLSFREGDRIRVIKKTGSSQDWWDGEIGGVKGQFPANYVQAG